jgi:streptogramin lyase
VSAKLQGGPVTVSVFTDENGKYFFPPLHEVGRYVVTAQAVGYGRAMSTLDIGNGVQRADLRLHVIENALLQLSGWQQLTALPEDTREQRRGKAILVRRCMNCHQTSRIFARRFDERGWRGVVDLMWDSIPNNPPPGEAEHKAELAKYLAEVSGGATPRLSLKLPPRPSGDSLLPVIYEYNVPNVMGGYAYESGSDWSQGPAIAEGTQALLHDATVDLDGNIWFSNPIPLPGRTIGKIDGVTGKTTSYGFPGDAPGSTGRSHGLITARDGTIWFTAALGTQLGVAHLGFVDPHTGERQVYRVPPGMANVTGWLNDDGQGNIWTSSAAPGGVGGVLRFDRKTKTFQEFRALSKSISYGAAGDALGGGWWAQINVDKLGYVEPSGKVGELDLPFTWGSAAFLKPEDMGKQELLNVGYGLGHQMSGSQMPRRIKADLQGEDLWVANYTGDSLLRVNIKTRQTTYYPAPAGGMGLYDVGIDSQHRVWVGIQNGDEIARFDPDTQQWTIYPLPSKGISARSLSVVERNGRVEVVVPANDALKAVRMIIRTKEDISELRNTLYAGT